MKSNIINGLLLITALSVASCSTQKMASNQVIEDDVYNTKAKAGTALPPPPPVYSQDTYADAVPVGPDGQYYDNTGDSDYQYYDSYASRIDRFSYSSPFNFYDDYYYTSPIYGGNYGYAGLGYGGYGYGAFGVGLGYGWGGYGYGGFGLGLGFGYGGFGGYGYGGYPFGYGGYYGYSPYGIGYGGGYPYWGVYSAYANSPRPFRGSGAPGVSGLATRSARGNSYNGNYPGVNAYPGRPVGSNSYGGRSTNSYGGNNGNNGYDGRIRAPRTDYPGYQQPRTTNSFPTNNGGNFGGGSRGGGSAPSGGGGGGRPGRP